MNIFVKQAGQYVSEEVASNLIAIIVQTPELHLYAVQKMYLALLKDTSQVRYHFVLEPFINILVLLSLSLSLKCAIEISCFSKSNAL
jgi:hypothetical protein